MARVVLNNITKIIGDHLIVKNLSLDIPDKEFFILVGPSGCGSVKGQIYDEVKQELLQAGASPEEAERRALEASSYDQSGGKIATGAALGALAGSTGMERAIGAIAHGTAKQAPGMARRVLTHGATEALPEAAQGAQEKLASNQALYEQGFDVAPGAGVVAAGTMEGLAGFGMGAAAGLPRPAVRAGDQLRAEGLQPERGPATRALNAAVEAAANKIDFDPSLAAAGQKLQGMAGLEQAGTAPGAAAPKQTFGNEIAYTPDPDTGRLAIGDATEIAKANIARTAAKHEPMPQDVADGIVAKATERGLNMVAAPRQPAPAGG
jgi:alkylated DNA nucleotide flippase Atl1